MVRSALRAAPTGSSSRPTSPRRCPSRSARCGPGRLSSRAPIALDIDAAELVQREREVLDLVAHRPGQRADRGTPRACTEHTVKSHLGSLFAKLGVHSRSEAIAAHRGTATTGDIHSGSAHERARWAQSTETIGMRRLFIVGNDAFIVQAMRFALQYSPGVSLFGVIDGRGHVGDAVREAQPDLIIVDGITRRADRRAAPERDPRGGAGGADRAAVGAARGRRRCASRSTRARWSACRRPCACRSLRRPTTSRCRCSRRLPAAAGALAPRPSRASARARARARDDVPADRARAGDPARGGGGPYQRADRPSALGDRADGQVPPVEHLSQARRLQPHRGEPVRTHARARGDAAPRRAPEARTSAAATPIQQLRTGA